MSEPLVSVFMPAYNQVAFIDDAIRSAVEQDYDNLEVVVGDDGSTDGTVQKIRQWADRFPGRVVPLVDAGHLGINGNCNRTLRACRGQYIAFGAGDDIFLPGKITRQVSWFEADPCRVMCGHTVEAFDSETGRTLYSTSASMPSRCGRGAAALVRQMRLLPGLSMMVRADAMPPHGYDERVPVVSDFKLQIDILARGGEYGFVDGVFARYRVHKHSLSQQSLVDPGMHYNYLQGFLIAIALTEAEHPGLLSACRTARATLLFGEGRWRQTNGDLASARAYFRAALAERVLSPKSGAALLLTLLPANVRSVFDRALAILRRGGDAQRVSR